MIGSVGGTSLGHVGGGRTIIWAPDVVGFSIRCVSGGLIGCASGRLIGCASGRLIGCVGDCEHLMLLVFR